MEESQNNTTAWKHKEVRERKMKMHDLTETFIVITKHRFRQYT